MRARYAIEFDCPEDEITVAEMPGNAYQVEGCGHVANYGCLANLGPNCWRTP